MIIKACYINGMEGSQFAMLGCRILARRGLGRRPAMASLPPHWPTDPTVRPRLLKAKTPSTDRAGRSGPGPERDRIGGSGNGACGQVARHAMAPVRGNAWPSCWSLQLMVRM
jgi:hypothetical protein